MSFTVQKTDKYLKIICPENIAEPEIKAWEAMTNYWLKEDFKLYLLDFSETKSIYPTFYRAATAFSRALKTSDRQLRSVNLNEKLEKEISTAGLEGIFQQIKK